MRPPTRGDAPNRCRTSTAGGEHFMPKHYWLTEPLNRGAIRPLWTEVVRVIGASYTSIPSLWAEFLRVIGVYILTQNSPFAFTPKVVHVLGTFLDRYQAYRNDLFVYREWLALFLKIGCVKALK